jgi:hypothetical protein
MISTCFHPVWIETDILMVEKGTQEILAASDEIASAIAQVKKGIPMGRTAFLAFMRLPCRGPTECARLKQSAVCW